MPNLYGIHRTGERKTKIKYYLLDGRDPYNYNWHSYDTLAELLAARSYFTQDDWKSCKVVKGYELAIEMKPSVVDFVESV